MHDHLPSSTATVVARSVMLASRDRVLSRLVPAGGGEMLEKMLSGVPGHWRRKLALRVPFLRSLAFAKDNFVVPGITVHYLVRKRRIELAVRDALAAGVTQVVIVAAGFDLLGWRLAREFPAVQFFELDHPATQRVKRASLRSSVNFHYTAADLAKTPPCEALSACAAFVPGRSTAFIVEGLTMYLTATEVADLLAACARTAGPQGTVAFTFMQMTAGSGRIAFEGQHPVLDWWLRLRGEPFRWGISQKELPAFLSRCGLGPPDVFDDSRLRAEILAPAGLAALPLARGECLCLCHPLAP